MFRKAQTRQAFTLIEMTIVIGIIFVLGALAFYGFTQAKIAVNNGSATRNVEAIAEAEESYKFVNNDSTSDFYKLASGTPPYLAASLSDGQHQGYNFWVIPEQLDTRNFFVYAQPEHYGVSGTKFIVYNNLTLREFDDYVEAGTYVLASGLAQYFPAAPIGWTGGGITGGTPSIPLCGPETCPSGSEPSLEVVPPADPLLDATAP